MARSSGLFPVVNVLNSHQEDAIKSFASKGLTASHFASRDWFDDSSHFLALSYLVKKKEVTIDEAFDILDQLDKNQADGISKSLDRQEVLGLNYFQIYALLKFNVPAIELDGLETDAQVNAVLALRKFGLKAENLRGQDWFKSDKQLEALIYLVTIKHLPVGDALSRLQVLKPLEALASSYEIKIEDIVGLEKIHIRLLMKQKEYEGLRTKDELKGLTQNQINIVRKLYRFGLTSELAKNLPDSEEMNFALNRMVTERGISVHDAIKLVDGLDKSQARGVAFGLEREDVIGLNEAQVAALQTCKTSRNGLTGADLRGKDWFDSRSHGEAFERLLQNKFFTVKEALLELDGLDGYRAYQIAAGTRSRDDIVGLTPWQLYALDNSELFKNGLRGHHLRGKDWFNSASNVRMLLGRYKSAGMDGAVAEQDGLNREQLSLLDYMTRDEILRLSPVQLSVLAHPGEYDIYQDRSLVIAADWLQTKEQDELLKALKCVGSTMPMLALVKKVSETPAGVRDLLYEINSGLIGNDDLHRRANAACSEAFEQTKDSGSTPAVSKGGRCAIL